MAGWVLEMTSWWLETKAVLWKNCTDKWWLLPLSFLQLPVMAPLWCECWASVLLSGPCWRDSQAVWQTWLLLISTPTSWHAWMKLATFLSGAWPWIKKKSSILSKYASYQSLCSGLMWMQPQHCNLFCSLSRTAACRGKVDSSTPSRVSNQSTCACIQHNYYLKLHVTLNSSSDASVLLLVQAKVVSEKCQSVLAGLTHGQCHLDHVTEFSTHGCLVLALFLHYFSGEEDVIHPSRLLSSFQTCHPSFGSPEI